jgi:hypothetical protein
MKEGLLGGTLSVSSRRSNLMLHAGLNLSRRRLEVCLVDDADELVAQLAAAPDTGATRTRWSPPACCTTSWRTRQPARTRLTVLGAVSRDLVGPPPALQMMRTSPPRSGSMSFRRGAVTVRCLRESRVTRALTANRSVHVDGIAVKVIKGERDSARDRREPDPAPGGGTHSPRRHGRAWGRRSAQDQAPSSSTMQGR